MRPALISLRDRLKTRRKPRRFNDRGSLEFRHFNLIFKPLSKQSKPVRHLLHQVERI